MTQETTERQKRRLARFWAKVDVRGAGECWPWKRAKNTSGYGNHYRGGQVLAHRFAYELTHGAIPAGLYVLHSCDNPPCCNPAHLSVGTQAENIKQRVLRCRSRGTPRKLSMQVAREMRALVPSMSVNAISKRFGVANAIVRQIVRGETYREPWMCRGYSFNDLDQRGADAGSLFADGFEEAAQLWALENLADGERRLLQVWLCGESREYRVERDGNTATAEAFTAEWCG
jgi:hypothetical protein